MKEENRQVDVGPWCCKVTMLRLAMVIQVHTKSQEHIVLWTDHPVDVSSSWLLSKYVFLTKYHLPSLTDANLLTTT